MSRMACSQMCTIRASLAFCLVLCSFRLTLGTEFAGGLQRLPAFVWSSEPYIASVSEGQTSRVSYETTSTASLAGILLGSFLGGDGAHSAAQHLLNSDVLRERAPETVLLFVGNQVNAQSLAEPSLADALQPLQRAVKGAGSSLSLPNVFHKGPSSVSELITQHLQSQSKAGTVHELGSCGGSPVAEASSSAVQSLLSQAADGTRVVVVCPESSGLQEEMDLLKDIQAVLANDSRRSVMAYASDPAYGTQGSLPARHLLSQRQLHKKAAKTFTCDAKCETQVKLLEAVILAITLISALITGSWMLNNLGTPTRFETPKDNLSRE